MHSDIRGLPISTVSAEAAAAFDHLVAGYLSYRADTPTRLDAVLAADPDFALAHCMKGYFAMLAFKQASVPVAVEEARTLSAPPRASAITSPRLRLGPKVISIVPSPRGSRSCAPIRMIWWRSVSPTSSISGSAVHRTWSPQSRT